MQPSPAAKPRGRAALRLRILSAAVLAPPVLLLLYLGSPFSDGLFVVAAALLGWEWARICGLGKEPVQQWVLAASVAVCVLLMVLGEPLAALGAALGGALLLYVWPSADELAGRLWHVLGVLYLGGTGSALVWLRQTTPDGWPLFLWLLLVVWATDIGAYAAGRTVGGPKVLPKISPNKTWAGLVGGMTCAAAAAALEASYFGQGWQRPLLLGAMLALTAQAGDFFESWVKRRHDVKDSSNLIPGHGGLFDRVDGLLAAGLGLALLTALGIGPF